MSWGVCLFGLGSGILNWGIYEHRGDSSIVSWGFCLFGLGSGILNWGIYEHRGDSSIVSWGFAGVDRVVVY